MRFLLLLAAIALAGCGETTGQRELAAKRKAERLAAADEALSKTPVPRRYQIDGHQLLVVDVPVQSFGMLETQRCFVWRDTELRTASLSCPQPPEIKLD